MPPSGARHGTFFAAFSVTEPLAKSECQKARLHPAALLGPPPLRYFVQHEVGQSIALVLSNRHILALDVAGFVEAFTECSDMARRGIGRPTADEADDRYCSLLRARRERPCRRRAPKQRDERASLHSINSSARPDNGSGTVSPSALAVLRLRTKMYLSACWTGRSPGFSPLRMRST